MKILNSEKMPKSNGHYSMCIEHNGTLYTAGQLPMDDDGNIPDGIEVQAALVFEKIENIVTAANSSKDKIIQMRLYISDIDMWPKVNAVYADFFGSHKPVRSIIPTRDLHYGCLIEAEAVAAVSGL